MEKKGWDRDGNILVPGHGCPNVNKRELFGDLFVGKDWAIGLSHGLFLTFLQTCSRGTLCVDHAIHFQNLAWYSEGEVCSGSEPTWAPYYGLSVAIHEKWHI